MVLFVGFTVIIFTKSHREICPEFWWLKSAVITIIRHRILSSSAFVPSGCRQFSWTMALRWCPRALPVSRTSLNVTRPFTSLVTPPRPRLLGQSPRLPPPSSFPHTCRRTIFDSFRRRAAQKHHNTATEAAIEFGQLCWKFTVYSGFFVTITIAGFFLYDVISSLWLALTSLVTNIPSSRNFQRHTGSVSLY